mmetsp:Transcript_8122/g.24153  ORF Transcript_8122/g.24153 Transcript_8122/m.24153 type:complete len:232 (+) Transcript_8122:399-1094(+)
MRGNGGALYSLALVLDAGNICTSNPNPSGARAKKGRSGGTEKGSQGLLPVLWWASGPGCCYRESQAICRWALQGAYHHSCKVLTTDLPALATAAALACGGTRREAELAVAPRAVHHRGGSHDGVRDACSRRSRLPRRVPQRRVGPKKPETAPLPPCQGGKQHVFHADSLCGGQQVGPHLARHYHYPCPLQRPLDVRNRADIARDGRDIRPVFLCGSLRVLYQHPHLLPAKY